jgi:hypothetical protein
MPAADHNDVIHLKPHQSIDLVPSSKSRNIAGLMFVSAAHKVVRNTEIERSMPAAGKEIYIEGNYPLRWSFRDGPRGPDPEPMTTDISETAKTGVHRFRARGCAAPGMTSLRP